MQPSSSSNQNRGRKGASNLIGFLIFILIIAGPQIIALVSNVVSRITNGTVTLSANMLPWFIAGLIGLATLVAIARGLNNQSNQRDPRLPTSTQPWPQPLQTDQLRSPTSPVQRDIQRRSFSRSDITTLRPQKLPGAPRFEPVVSGKIIAFGILGLVLLGSGFGAIILYMLLTTPTP